MKWHLLFQKTPKSIATKNHFSVISIKRRDTLSNVCFVYLWFQYSNIKHDLLIWSNQGLQIAFLCLDHFNWCKIYIKTFISKLLNRKIDESQHLSFLLLAIGLYILQQFLIIQEIDEHLELKQQMVKLMSSCILNCTSDDVYAIKWEFKSRKVRWCS